MTTLRGLSFGIVLFGITSPTVTAQQWVAKVQTLYANAVWPGNLAVSNESTVMRVARSHTATPRLVASSNYFLAARHPQNPQHVQRMVRAALRGKSDEDLMLPPVLETLFIRTHSNAALYYLMTLRLDGAPAEALSDAQYAIALRSPSIIGHYLRKRYKTIQSAIKLKGSWYADSFVSGLALFIIDSPEDEHRLLNAANSARSMGANFLAEIAQRVYKRGMPSQAVSRRLNRKSQ